MAKIIKVIIKRTDEKYGHVANVSNTLDNLQKLIGGRIEVHTLMVSEKVGENLIMICNADRKNFNLSKNFIWGKPPFHDVIVGDVVICGAWGDDFTDVPINFETWKYLIDRHNDLN